MIYKILKAIVKPIFFALFRIKVVGKENARYEGKMIMYSNHVSAIDPVFTHCLVNVMPHYMAKKEIFQNRFVIWLVTKLGAFPVDRSGADMASIKTAFRILKDGGTLGIFPEGMRSKTGQMGPFLPGAAMLAVRANAPALPVYISGKERLFRRTYIMVGAPFNVKQRVEEANSEGADAVSLAGSIMREEIVKLKEQYEALCRK